MSNLTLIVDGNNVAWRAKYAYNLSYRGMDVSVLYGSVRMLMSYIKKFRPSSVIYCWDGGIPGFRRELVPSYKANRKRDMNDETYLSFIHQVDELRGILPVFGVLSVWRTGIEADDLMFHSSCMLEDSIIVSNDDDLLQAVSDFCYVLQHRKRADKLITPDDMEIAPERYIEWKALQGDSSDNIAGVRGVGPKTAGKIINGENVSKRVKRNLDVFMVSGKYEQAYTCMDLSCDRAGARYTLLQSVGDWTPFDSATCKRWVMELGFISLIEDRPLGMTFGDLQCPQFYTDGIAIPRVWDYKRFPCE